MFWNLLGLKFIYSEKAPKFCEIFTLLLTVCTVVKSKVKISQNFVAFSEYMSFNNIWQEFLYFSLNYLGSKLLCNNWIRTLFRLSCLLYSKEMFTQVSGNHSKNSSYLGFYQFLTSKLDLFILVFFELSLNYK